MKHLLSYFKPHKQQEKLPSGDFFVTIARKLSSMNTYIEKEPRDESLSACKYRDL